MRLLSPVLLLTLIVLSLAGAACTADPTEEPLPTLAQMETLPTAIFLTENAPPPGFGLVSFDPIDANLGDRQGWFYTITGRFDGEFVESGDEAEGEFEIQVWANELGEARRVVLAVEGLALSPDEGVRRLEGVRLSNDYFIVDSGGQCTLGGEGATVIADLAAGQIIGGVVRAVPNGFRMEIEGVPAWQYTFAPEDARLPALHQGSDSVVDLSAELWIAPQYNAVLRYDIVAQVENVRVLWSEAPVSGQLVLHYAVEAATLDTLPNITVPHGC
ncbi:MAG: hypothetical protein GXY36_01990 [Chloroflexi bacterium]|nr:hypothetical protein [Chloroflexota bacterium]